MKSNHETAVEIVQLILKDGRSPSDMIEILAEANGIVCAGMAFSVIAKGKTEKQKALEFQMSIAKATRYSVTSQDDDDFDQLSFESMF